MAVVQQFAYGALTPSVSYGVSVLGSLLGLVCTSRARQGRTPLKRAGWLTLAAISIGGTGIWLMHFLAMIGFAVDGSDVRYNVGLTVLSAVLAIAVVGIGLAILGTGPAKPYRVGLGGLFAGIGVAGMHYTGMAAMRINGAVAYNLKVVVLSVVIAVVAATAALWFTVIAHSVWVITVAALIMGVAVTAMHYVGMYALGVTLDDHHSAASGADVATVLPIIAGFTGIVMIVLLYAALSIPPEDEQLAFALPAPAGATEASVWTPRVPAQRSPSDTQSHPFIEPR